MKVIIAGNQAATKSGICAEAPKACKKLDEKKTIKPILTPAKIIKKALLLRGGLKENAAANNIIDINKRG